MWRPTCAHAVIAAHPPAGSNAFALVLIFVIQPIVGGALIAMTSELRRAEGVGSFVVTLVVALIAFGVAYASAFASLDGMWRWMASAVAVLLIVAGTLALAMSAAATLLAYDLSSIACVVEGASP